ncbi:hypothetical protein LV780_20860 (plasmid) [Cereibacter azotoformans]|uniref:hypothetical protein n=1 Tax=Cereibacter azotoformans TaxID=43057 RepID=UPI0015E6862C|nr:hypothetical protein [Cereibacter azotoformans]UIJ33196.1 hypothetical protein LV780_20860 [Cereibacter azotoformans]
MLLAAESALKESERDVRDDEIAWAMAFAAEIRRRIARKRTHRQGGSGTTICSTASTFL